MNVNDRIAAFVRSVRAAAGVRRSKDMTGADAIRLLEVIARSTVELAPGYELRVQQDGSWSVAQHGCFLRGDPNAVAEEKHRLAIEDIAERVDVLEAANEVLTHRSEEGASNDEHYGKRITNLERRLDAQVWEPQRPSLSDAFDRAYHVATDERMILFNSRLNALAARVATIEERLDSAIKDLQWLSGTVATLVGSVNRLHDRVTKRDLAALEDNPPPNRSACVDDPCRCGHFRRDHHGTAGACVVPDCMCGDFTLDVPF